MNDFSNFNKAKQNESRSNPCKIALSFPKADVISFAATNGAISGTAPSGTKFGTNNAACGRGYGQPHFAYPPSPAAAVSRRRLGWYGAANEMAPTLSSGCGGTLGRWLSWHGFDPLTWPVPKVAGLVAAGVAAVAAAAVAGLVCGLDGGV